MNTQEEKKLSNSLGNSKSVLANIVDQNTNESLELKYVALLTSSMESAAKKTVSNVKDVCSTGWRQGWELDGSDKNGINN